MLVELLTPVPLGILLMVGALEAGMLRRSLRERWRPLRSARDIPVTEGIWSPPQESG